MRVLLWGAGGSIRLQSLQYPVHTEFWRILNFFPNIKCVQRILWRKLAFFVSQQSGKKRGVARHLAWHLSSVPSKFKVSCKILPPPLLICSLESTLECFGCPYMAVKLAKLKIWNIGTLHLLDEISWTHLFYGKLHIAQLLSLEMTAKSS